MKCKKCLLPAEAPGAELNAAGICRACREPAANVDAETRRQRYEQDLAETLETYRGHGKYDCLVNLSGGKDSCLLLYKLKCEHGMSPLAFTTDMNIPEIAWKNIRRTVERLDVPHLTFRPPKSFYQRLFRYLLQHQEQRGAVRTVCYVCAPLFEGYSLKVATEKRIPLVFAGYSPGQPDADRMEYEFSRELLCQTDWTPATIRESGLFTPAELEYFWDPNRYGSDVRIPRYLAPFHAWPYSQEEAMRDVVELGLIANRKSANPIHSNCPVNWLLMYSDLKHLGYNPYAPEFSQLIREGKANLWQWKILGPLVNFMIRRKWMLGRNVARSLQWLEMDESDLAIDCAPGTHDAVCRGCRESCRSEAPGQNADRDVNLERSSRSQGTTLLQIQVPASTEDHATIETPLFTSGGK